MHPVRLSLNHEVCLAIRCQLIAIYCLSITTKRRKNQNENQQSFHRRYAHNP